MAIDNIKEVEVGEWEENGNQLEREIEIEFDCGVRIWFYENHEWGYPSNRFPNSKSELDPFKVSVRLNIESTDEASIEAELKRVNELIEFECGDTRHDLESFTEIVCYIGKETITVNPFHK